jgi:iron-sulfur cluster repair protein YtfE (RIC family)
MAAWREAEDAFDLFAAQLRRHIALEEGILFPVFAKRTGIVGPISVMKEEHRRLEQLLDVTARWIAAKDGITTVESLGTLADLILVHNAKEERILYPKVDQALSPEERTELVARLLGSP